jgi:ribosomal-protein-alanine N-acetyltransferase
MDPIDTARLRLEPLERAHAEALFAGLADARVYRFIADGPPADVETLRSRYARWETRQSPDGRERWLNWALFLPAERRYIGHLQATVYADGEADVAYVLRADAWGHGYAREATRAMIAWLRAHQRVGVVRATVDTRNRASIALLEALGFGRVAVRVAAEWIQGVCTDEAEYRLAGAPAPPGRDRG